MSSLFSLQGGPACACSQRLGGGAASRAAGAAPCRLGASSCRRSAGAPRGAVRKAWSTRSRAALQVQAFSLARSLGIPSGPHSWLPGLLPDFGLTRRQAVLDAFFRISDGGPALDAELYEALLAPGFRWTETVRQGGQHTRTHFKADFIDLMCRHVAPALPDFTWSAATDGVVDRDGYAVVEVKISGHQVAPLALPGLPALAPSGRRLVLETEYLKVKVEGDRLKQVVVLPSSNGAGPLALYTALGGQVA